MPGNWPRHCSLLMPARWALTGLLAPRLPLAPPAIRGSGYQVASPEAALWAFAATRDYAAGALRAINLGEAADTTGAVYGRLAGAD